MLTAPLIALVLAAGGPPGYAASGTYLYDLSDNTGPVASSWATLRWDAQHKELYVVDRSDNSVGIFNDAGMEIYRFGQDAEIGSILDVGVLSDGNLLALVYDKGAPALYRLNFRGDPKQRIPIRDLPEPFAKDFAPDTMVVHKDTAYLAHRGTLKVAAVDASGKCLQAHDYYRELKIDQLKTARGGAPAMQGFNIDGDGNVLFTVGALFKAYIIAPDGKVTAFGERGGSPGRFNVVGGVTRDENRNLLITDMLRGVVMVFAPDLEFRGEFAMRGWGKGQLIAPLWLTAGDAKVYVSQSADRGVSVFRYQVPPPPPPPPPVPETAPTAQQ